MKKLLLLVFAATLVLFFTPNTFAQSGKTVKVANNAELIRALNDPNVKYVEITQDGFYDAVMMDATNGTTITKQDGTSRATCTFAIERTDECYVDDTTHNEAHATVTGDPTCPSYPTGSTYGWSSSSPGLHFDLTVMDSITNPTASFTTDFSGQFNLDYHWNDRDYAHTVVTLYGSPEITQLVANPDTVCGDSTQITFDYTMNPEALDTTVTWYVNDVQDASLPTEPGSFYFNPGQCGAYQLVLSVTNSDGCNEARDTLDLYFYDKPVANAGQDQEVCGLTATTQGTGSASCMAGGQIDLTWSQFSGPGTADFYGGNDSVTVSQCGTYEFILTAANGLCDGTDTVTMKFYDTPTVNAGTDQEVCGLSAILSPNMGVTCENGGTATGVWSGTGLTFVGDTATAASCGTYQAIYTVTNGPCSNSDTVELKFYDTPVVNAGTDQEICGLEAILAPQFTATCQNGDTATGAWSGTGLTFNGDTATAAICGIYEAVYTVTNGPCTNSDTVELKFYEAPVADAGPDSVNVCGLTADLNGTYSGGCTNGDPVVESWAVVSGGGIIHGDTAVEVTQCGETVLEYIVTVGPCESRDTIKYKFTDLPVVTAGGPGEVCGTTDASGNYTGIADLTGDFTAQCIGDTSYNWSVCTKPAGSNVQWYPGNDVRNPQVTVNMCGFYQFTFEVFNGPNCSSVDTVSVKFYDKPVVDAGQDAEVCGDSLTLAPTWSVQCDMSAQGGAVSTQWQVVGQAPGNATFYGDTAVSVDACGTYTFIYHVTNGACCTCDTLVAKFYDTPVVMAGPDQEICGLEATLAPSFDAICQNGDTATGVWSGTGLTFNGDTATAAACGTYEAVYTVTNGPCVNSDTLTLKFYDTPVVTAGPDQKVCGLEAVLAPTFTVACENGDTATGVWTSSSPDLYFSGDTLATAAYCGTYEAVYTVTNGPCTSSDTLILEFYDTPMVMAGPDQDICGLEATLAPSFDAYCQNSDTATGVWSGTGLTFSGDTLATAAVCGTYEAVYTVTNGPCVNSDTLVLKFYDTPVVDAGDGDTLCATNATLAGTHTEACTNGGTVDVAWTKVSGPGTVVFSDTAIDNPTVDVGQCGEYQFKYTVTNGPCTAFDTVSYYFTDTPDITTLMRSDTICGFDASVTAFYNVDCGLDDTAVLSGTGPGNITIVYDPNATSNNYSVQVSTCGDYTFLYHVTNGDCVADSTFHMVFFETPDPTIVGDDTVYTCSTTTYGVTDPGCNDPDDITYEWNVTGGVFASGVTTPTTASVDVMWDNLGGPAELTVHTRVDAVNGCEGFDTLTIEKIMPTLEGQVKYWNSEETYMPSPFETSEYCNCLPFDYFYVILAVDQGNGLMDLDTAKVEVRLADNLPALMSYFNFDLLTDMYGCDAKYFLRVWDGGFVYHNNPPLTADKTVLGHNYTYNNWGGVNATDALAIQLMAANTQVNAAPYNYTWVGTNNWSPSYGYYSQGIADVNHTFGNGGNVVTGITALDALTAKYRAVGLLGSYPDNSDANNNQFRPNFVVTGRMVPSLPFVTFPTPFDSTHVDDVPFTHSGNEYMYGQQAVDHKYTSDSLPWGGKENFINLYYEAVGDVNASFIPPGSGLKSKPAMTLDYEGLASTAVGGVMTIPVSVESDVNAVGAISLSFNYRNDLIEVLGTNYSDDDMFISQEDGILNIGWFSTEPVSFDANATIAQIRVRVLAEIPEGTELFELNDISELADENAQTIADVNLKTIGVTTDKGISNAAELTTSNYPNPFDDITTISYTLPENGKVKVEVYNSVGMLVKVLVDEYQEAGVNNVNFNASNEGPGVYVYHITVQGETNNYTAVKRMIVVH